MFVKLTCLNINKNAAKLLQYASVYYKHVFPGAGNTTLRACLGGIWNQTQGLEHATRPSWLSLAVIKLTKNNSGTKGFVWLILPGHKPSLREVRTETEDKTMEQCCSLAYVHLGFYIPDLLAQGQCYPQQAGPALLISQDNLLQTRFLANLISYYPVNLSCVKVTKIYQHTMEVIHC